VRTEELEALVINLPQAEGRRRLMRAQLEQPGMPKYRLVEGVDGRKLAEAELPAVYDAARAERDFGRGLTRGELGCALGHVAAYRSIVERTLPYALVLEDDAVLGHQFLMVLERLVPMMELAKPQVILLSHVGRYSAWGSRRVDKHHRLYRPYTAWGGHAYLATLPAAKALLASQQPVHVMPDSWMYFYRTGVVDVRGLVPYLVGTAPLAAASMIGDERLKLNQRRGLRRWIRKYVWQKFVFQLVVKPALRLWKQDSTW
jgi:glycosyl transferase family 25